MRVPYFFSGLHACAQQYFPIKMNKKWGLIDADGKIFLEPKYDAIGEFKKYGYAIMQRNGGVGMLNLKGREVVPPKYDDMKILDSLLVAVKDEGDWQVMNLKGDVILEKGYQQVLVWQGEYLGYRKDGKWGIANRSGAQLCAPSYDEIKLRSDGFFQTRQGEFYGLLSLTGEEVLPASCFEIEVMNKDLIMFKRGEFWGAVNGLGKELMPQSFQSYRPVSDQFIKLLNGNQVALYSVKAEQIISDGYFSNYYPFSSDKVLCKKNRLLGLMDWQGNVILNDQYNEIQLFSDSCYRAKYHDRWGLVGVNDAVIVPFEYDYIAHLPKPGLQSQKRGLLWCCEYKW